MCGQLCSILLRTRLRMSAQHAWNLDTLLPQSLLQKGQVSRTIYLQLLMETYLNALYVHYGTTFFLRPTSLMVIFLASLFSGKLLKASPTA